MQKGLSARKRRDGDLELIEASDAAGINSINAERRSQSVSRLLRRGL